MVLHCRTLSALSLLSAASELSQIPGFRLSPRPGPQLPGCRGRPSLAGTTGAVAANRPGQTRQTPACCFGGVPVSAMARLELPAEVG